MMLQRAGQDSKDLACKHNGDLWGEEIMVDINKEFMKWTVSHSDQIRSDQSFSRVQLFATP